MLRRALFLKKHKWTLPTQARSFQATCVYGQVSETSDENNGSGNKKNVGKSTPKKRTTQKKAPGRQTSEVNVRISPKKQNIDDDVNTSIEALKSISENRFQPTCIREVASSVASFLSKHSRDSPNARQTRSFKEKPVTKEERNAVWVFLRNVMTFNRTLSDKLCAYHFNGESSMKLVKLIENVRLDSLHVQSPIKSMKITKGQIVYSVPDVFNVLLRAIAKEGNWQQSLKVFGWIVEDGFKPDYNTYMAVLESFGRSKSDFITTSQILKQMEEDGHRIEDLLWRGQFEGDGLEYVLKAVLTSSPSFRPIPPTQFMQRDKSQLKKFPVLQRCLEAELTSTNPIHGVQTLDELKKNYERQLELELEGTKPIKPIAIFNPKHQARRRDAVRTALAEEKKLWNERLTAAFQSFLNAEKSKPGMRSNYQYFTLFPASVYIDLLIKEVEMMVSETSIQYIPSVVLYSRLGNRVFNLLVLKYFEKGKLKEKLTKTYKEYVEVYAEENRKPESVNYSDVWHRINSSVAKDLNLDSPWVNWSTPTQMRIGRILYELVYYNLKFDVNISNLVNKERVEIPVIYEVLVADGTDIHKEIKIHPRLVHSFKVADLPSLQFPPSKLPMLCPPVPWVRPEMQQYSGYLIARDYTTKLVRQVSSEDYRPEYAEEIRRDQLHPMLDAINALNAVPWRVNKPVFDILLRVFRAGGDPTVMKRLGLPVPQGDMPEVAKMPETKMKYEEISRIYQEIAETRKRQRENYSLWADVLYRLSIAQEYADETFWFPHSMDFRGRVYPCPPHFNYMGSDASRSMLKFAKGKPLGSKGLDWLLIHLINLTGLKKRSSNADRLAFANTLHDEIIDSAENPLTGRGWWRTGDEPWQILACCVEITAALKSPDHREFISDFPVHQDGSCNGLQHYAALGRDTIGARSVNLINSEIPQDVYGDVGELVEEQRKADAANGLAIAQVLEGFVKRKVIKQSVMTTVYGVTLYGASQQISRQLRDIEEFPSREVPAAAAYLAKHTLSSIGRIFTSSVHIQNWLVKSAREIAKFREARVAWETPLGLTVTQPYVTSARIKRKRDDKSLIIPDGAKQGRAFPPNYVHSLDSTHMMLTALHCQRAGITFAAVHDCYWTHAHDIDTLNKICREQFVALHEQPLLQNLSQSLQRHFAYTDDNLAAGLENETSDNLKKSFNWKLKAVPELGNFDLDEVLKSEYFFS